MLVMIVLVMSFVLMRQKQLAHLPERFFRFQLLALIADKGVFAAALEAFGAFCLGFWDLITVALRRNTANQNFNHTLRTF